MQGKGIIQKIFEKVTGGLAKDVEKNKDGQKLYTRMDSVEEGYNILAAVEKEQASGLHKADVVINTMIEADLVEYLNYAVKLIPEKYTLNKMLLTLRINPVKMNPITGDGVYLSKKYIAQSLTKHLKKVIKEEDIDKLEKQSINICQQFIRKTKETALPILS